jgi:hypothetical protein
MAGEQNGARGGILSSVRKGLTSAVLLGLALAILAPAFAAGNPAPDCGMSCCRLGTMGMMGSPRTAAPAPGMPGKAGCTAPCGMRGSGGPPPVATLAGLPPSIVPTVSPLPAPAVAAPLSEAAFRIPFSLSLDLPDQPPRA